MQPLVFFSNFTRLVITVFMAGTEGYGLVIYNKNLGFYRIESDFMNATDPTMEGQSFYSKDSSRSLTIINKCKYPVSNTNII
ncbi:Major royal jelly protein 1 [Temnothorax longispinosus]|uniref:Major royal jelly protein 1 n=1 Tax=Temnothorax longispinosus TaxID=300112 RepID=A0A4S2L645_9HYME|nr:Major royal jelly protein 1 [Temnothorax longispinosus]